MKTIKLCPHGLKRFECRPCEAEYQRQWRNAKLGSKTILLSRWRQFDKNRLIAKTCFPCGTMHTIEHFSRRANGCYAHICKKQAALAAKMQARKNPAPYVASARRSRLRRLYGLTETEADAMLRDQKTCAICDKSFEPGRRPHIDHDHATGTVRGLLCGSCNQGLGCFKDQTGLLLRAVEYLNRKT